MAGGERKIHFLALDLPHSDACLVQAYPWESSEAFCEGHRVAFEFFGGVPRSILYDKTKLPVARILGDGRRLKTRVFSELQSHYQCAAEGVDHARYLMRLTELEMIDRERRMVERRIKEGECVGNFVFGAIQ